MKRDRPRADSGADYRDLLEGTPDLDLERLVADLDALFSSAEVPARLGASLDRVVRDTSPTVASAASRRASRLLHWPPLQLASRPVSGLVAVLALVVVLGVFAVALGKLQETRLASQQLTPTALSVQTPRPAPAVQVETAPTPVPSPSPTDEKPATATPVPLTGPAESSTVTAEVRSLAASPQVSAATFLDASRGWVAQGASILGTTDDGGTWTPIRRALSSLDALDFADAEHRVAFRRPLPESPVLTSSDGGRTWRQVGSLGQKGAVALDCLDAQRCWALAAEPADSGHVALYSTADGGKSWRKLADFAGQADYPQEVSFADASTGYVGGALGYLAVTLDGGRTLTGVSADGPLPRPAVEAIDFVSAERGWRILGGDLEATSDGGRSWSRIPLGGRALDAGLVSTSTAWVIAAEPEGSPDQARLLSTRDGGATWTGYDLGNIAPPHRVLFADETRVVLETLDGSSLATSDSGRTWVQVR